MRSITLRPGESLKIGDTMISAEYSDFKSEYSHGDATELFPLKRKNPGGPQGPEELLDFLNAQSVEDQRAFAARCGTSVGYLRQVGYGQRRCSASFAIAIDRESGGVISFESLCPDADWEHVRRKLSYRPSVAEAAFSKSTFPDFPALDDLRPILVEILAKGVKQSAVADRLGISGASVSEALNGDRDAWTPSYPNGVRLMQMYREVCGKGGDDA